MQQQTVPNDAYLLDTNDVLVYATSGTGDSKCYAGDTETEDGDDHDGGLSVKSNIKLSEVQEK